MSNIIPKDHSPSSLNHSINEKDDLPSKADENPVNLVTAGSKKTGNEEWAKSKYESCKNEIISNKNIVSGENGREKVLKTKRAQAFGRLLLGGTKLAGLAIVLGFGYAAKHGSAMAAAFGRSIVQSYRNFATEGDKSERLNPEYQEGLNEIEGGFEELVNHSKRKEDQTEVEKELYKDFGKPSAFKEIKNSAGEVESLEIQLSKNVTHAINLMKTPEDRSEVAAHLLGLTSVERGSGKAVDKSKMEALLDSPEVKNNPELKKAVLQEARQIYDTSACELMSHIVWDRLEATGIPKSEKNQKHDEWQKKAEETPFTDFGIEDLVRISRAVNISEDAIPDDLTRDHEVLQYRSLNLVVDQLLELKSDLDALE